LVLPTFWQSTQKPGDCDQTFFFTFRSSPSPPSPPPTKNVWPARLANSEQVAEWNNGTKKLLSIAQLYQFT